MSTAHFKAFLCYGSEDRGFVDDLYFELSTRGETAFYDKVCIAPGDSLYDLIEEGLKTSRYFCIILSSRTVNKPWVKRELQAALALEDEKPPGAFKIIPILYDIEHTDIPLWLKGRKYVDFSLKHRGLAEFLRALGKKADAVSVILRDYPSIVGRKALIKVGHTTLEEHAQVGSFPSEAQSLCKLLTVLPLELRHIFAKYDSRNEWKIHVQKRLLSILSGFDWVHGIWVHGQEKTRILGDGSLDLILNPDLDGEHASIMTPYGVLISAHKNGELLGPARRLLFSVFICIGSRDIIYVATNGILHKYVFIGREDNLVLANEALEISGGDTISFYCSCKSIKQLPDDILRNDCMALLDNMEAINPGLVGSLNCLLSRGGVLVNAGLPNDPLDETCHLQGELKPMSHLVYCGFGESKIAGGADLVDLRVANTNKRVSAFFFSKHYDKAMGNIVQRWPASC